MHKWRKFEEPIISKLSVVHGCYQIADSAKRVILNGESSSDQASLSACLRQLKQNNDVPQARYFRYFTPAAVAFLVDIPYDGPVCKYSKR